jgi:hypothetical protein
VGQAPPVTVKDTIFIPVESAVLEDPLQLSYWTMFNIAYPECHPNIDMEWTTHDPMANPLTIDSGFYSTMDYISYDNYSGNKLDRICYIVTDCQTWHLNNYATIWSNNNAIYWADHDLARFWDANRACHVDIVVADIHGAILESIIDHDRFTVPDRVDALTALWNDWDLRCSTETTTHEVVQFVTDMGFRMTQQKEVGNVPYAIHAVGVPYEGPQVGRPFADADRVLSDVNLYTMGWSTAPGLVGDNVNMVTPNSHREPVPIVSIPTYSVELLFAYLSDFLQSKSRYQIMNGLALGQTLKRRAAARFAYYDYVWQNTYQTELALHADMFQTLPEQIAYGSGQIVQRAITSAMNNICTHSAKFVQLLKLCSYKLTVAAANANFLPAQWNESYLHGPFVRCPTRWCFGDDFLDMGEHLNVKDLKWNYRADVVNIPLMWIYPQNEYKSLDMSKKVRAIGNNTVGSNYLWGNNVNHNTTFTHRFSKGSMEVVEYTTYEQMYEVLIDLGVNAKWHITPEPTHCLPVLLDPYGSMVEWTPNQIFNYQLDTTRLTGALGIYDDSHAGEYLQYTDNNIVGSRYGDLNW